jgi:hypothetical protein
MGTQATFAFQIIPMCRFVPDRAWAELTIDKPPSELFAAITRWMEAGTVKRKDPGLYERV